MGGRNWGDEGGYFFFSSRRRHTRCSRDWSSDVCSSDLTKEFVTTNARKGGLIPILGSGARYHICVDAIERRLIHRPEGLWNERQELLSSEIDRKSVV